MQTTESTYAEILEQIDNLQKIADKKKRSEVQSAIKQIRDLMRVFQLTASDIGLAEPVKKARGNVRSSASKNVKKNRKASSRGPVEKKYADGLGNTWTGRGKQPKWLVAAISAGRSLEEFKIIQEAVR